MKKISFLLLVLLISFTLSSPVRCIKAAEALENMESVVNDDCSGRVCQAICSCGESVYFNLEKIVKKDENAYKAYTDTCFGSGFGLGKEDDFIFGELKKSLDACGVKQKADNFLKMKAFMESKLTEQKPAIRGPPKIIRVAFPPYVLFQFALQLREFAKICQEQGDFNQVSLASLNKKLEITKAKLSSDLKGRNSKCILEQANVMKQNFANIILKNRHEDLDFCSCKRLAVRTVEVKVYTRGKFFHWEKVTPFAGFNKKFEKECKKVCSNSTTLEFLN
jgi:hypothetical protein